MPFDPYGPGGRRTKLASFNPAHVFRFPPGATWMNRDKSRPFVLLHRCGPGELGALAYGSTRATQKHLGTACIEVLPVRTGVNANGLAARTFFYPGILLSAHYEDLPTHSGVLGRSMEELRAATRIALGIGTGSGLRPGVPAGSRRGRIVILHAGFAPLLRTRLAVLLTEHVYSREKAYHLIVPIIREASRRADPGVLRVTDARWLDAFDPRPASALLPARIVQSVWYESDIVEETPFVLDEGTLEALERQLCTIFGLAPA
jgi:hypothetical protein